MDDQEDILRSKQLSLTALYNLSNIWIRKNRIREHLRLKLYETIVKPVLMYNNRTSGLPVNDEHNLGSFHRQKLRTVLHIKFLHAISNSNLYQRTNEISLTLIILKNRWSHTSSPSTNTSSIVNAEADLGLLQHPRWSTL